VANRNRDRLNWSTVAIATFFVLAAMALEAVTEGQP
jgi:hypothetical protein